MIYVTSDEHYNNANIILYCKRPFDSWQQMNKTLIENHNSIVTDADEVYHIGDFIFAGKEDYRNITKIISQLNGRHHLILGNHDKLKPFTYVNCGLTSVHTSYDLTYCGIRVIMNHDPCVYCMLPPNVLFLHGHIHTLYKQFRNCVNVGVDMHEFKPIKLVDLLERFILQ